MISKVEIDKKIRVGIIGATGYYGQTFLSVLENHPWFEVCAICASPRTAGKLYEEAIEGRWKLERPIPESIRHMRLISVTNLVELCDQVDFIFCTTDLSDDDTSELEKKVALLETPVISNHSSHLDHPDIPVIFPEINPDHTGLINNQRLRFGTEYGFIVSKPVDIIQNFLPAITPLLDFGLEQLTLCINQSIIGSNRVLANYPELVNNIIPFDNAISEKIRIEPNIIWGDIEDGQVKPLTFPKISSQCSLVSIENGNMAAVFMKFERKPDIDEVIKRWSLYKGDDLVQNLPSYRSPFLKYLPDIDRPQPCLDNETGNGMTISLGSLREDINYDYKFLCLSNNSMRGGPGGVILTAELLVKQGYIKHK